MPFVGTVDVAVWLVLRSALLVTETYANIPQNSGLYRPITIVAPEGALANPIFPVPTIARVMAGNVLCDTVVRALSQALPQQVCAGIGNLKVIAASGFRRNRPWVHLEIFEGSYGGRYGRDGMDAVDTLFPGKLILQTSNGEEIPLPPKVPYRSVKTGDLFIAVGATGGGYGDPLQRDPRQVLEDVRDGYYSVATAERDYGVMITERLQLDEAATEVCRRKRKEAMSH